MPCKLTKLNHPPHAFSGPIGQSVTITVSGHAAVITSVAYDDQAIPPPWTFSIKQGRKVLVVIVVSQPQPPPGNLVKIEEKCNGTTQVLMEFVYDDAFPRVFVIAGA
jgi:hypothetical protein